MEVQLSRHALHRALDMALEPDEIKQAIDSHVTVPTPQHGEGTVRWVSGRIALAIDENQSPPMVVTVLWSSDEAWAADAALAPLAAGRKLRADMRDASTA